MTTLDNADYVQKTCKLAGFVGPLMLTGQTTGPGAGLAPPGGTKVVRPLGHQIARSGIIPAAMAIPKEVTFVTFDVYGTLIDWETGAYEAFKTEADRDGFTVERDELIPLFYEVQRQIQAGSYELYAEVLRRTAVQIAEALGWPLEPSRAGFLPDSVQRWPPFEESNPALQDVAKKHKVGLLSNIDDKLLGQTRRQIDRRSKLSIATPPDNGCSAREWGEIEVQLVRAAPACGPSGKGCRQRAELGERMQHNGGRGRLGPGRGARATWMAGST